MFKLWSHKSLLIVAVALCIPFSFSVARTVKGTVCFRDSVIRPAISATVYIPDLKSGTTVSPDGTFSLETGSLSTASSHTVEFSFIGYETEIRNITSGGSDDLVIDTVFLQPQLLMLPAAYVVPGNMDPARYILKQVSRQAAINKKKFKSYSMDIHYDFHTSELPVVAEIFPKAALGSVKVFGGLAGFGPMIRYALENDDFYASVSFKRRIDGKRTYDTDFIFVESGTELPPEVRQNLVKTSDFVDLDDLLYSDDCLWGKNHNSSFKFELVGTYQFGDYLVDVLKWTDRKNRISATVHVVEDVWGILKVEAGYGKRLVRCEARDIGGGYYLPVSFTVSPSIFPTIRAERIPDYIEKIKNDRRLDKATKKRIVRTLENHQGQDLHPFVAGSFSIKYN